MRFLIDANVPPLTAQMLRASGYEAYHVFDVGMASGRDEDIWGLADREARILISKDVDFAYMALSGAPGPQVVWVRCGNLKLSAYQPWFAARWAAVEALLAGGERLIEMR